MKSSTCQFGTISDWESDLREIPPLYLRPVRHLSTYPSISFQTQMSFRSHPSCPSESILQTCLRSARYLYHIHGTCQHDRILHMSFHHGMCIFHITFFPITFVLLCALPHIDTPSVFPLSFVFIAFLGAPFSVSMKHTDLTLIFLSIKINYPAVAMTPSVVIVCIQWLPSLSTERPIAMPPFSLKFTTV